MQIYNTLTRTKEEFKPRHGKTVQMFVCGPTVYDFSHIGHARTYIFYDTLARYLHFRGYDVFYLQNITNIDDKIIERAKRDNKEPLKLSAEFEKEYLNDMAALGIHSVDKYARATDYIPQIISQIKRLIEKGFAYEIEKDGIYFDLSRFADYGKLSGRTIQGAEDATSRIDDSINKRNKGDFCLWKLSNGEDISWPSEFGEGRPGWHIEDTAITEAEFGSQYDLHGGALELIFPHHEAEVAQMEAISGKKPLVKYWVHTGLVTVDGKKMSKSLGNFVTISNLLKDYSKEIIRFMALSSHYRSPMDYNDDFLKQSQAAVDRISEFKNRLSHYDGGSNPIEEKQKDKLSALYSEAFEALDDDLNFPKAFGIFFEVIKLVNSFIDEEIDFSEFKEVLMLVDFFDHVIGIVPKKLEIPEEVRILLKKRELARNAQDFEESDKLRDKIIELGYEIDDTSTGQIVKKVNK